MFVGKKKKKSELSKGCQQDQQNQGTTKNNREVGGDLLE